MSKSRIADLIARVAAGDLSEEQATKYLEATDLNNVNRQQWDKGRGIYRVIESRREETDAIQEWLKMSKDSVTIQRVVVSREGLTIPHDVVTVLTKANDDMKVFGKYIWDMLLLQDAT